MPESNDIRSDLDKDQAGLFLPVDKELIAWSLVLGVVLLLVLSMSDRCFPFPM